METMTMAEFISDYGMFLLSIIFVVGSKLVDLKVISAKLNTICEQVKKTNSRVTKLEDYNINHLDKYHSKH